MNQQLLAVTHLFATLFMVGVIWIIQCVHYQLLDRVGDASFVRYEAEHGRLISPIVGPMMVIELITGFLLVAGFGPNWIPSWACWGGLLAIVVIWLSTFCLQVPYHNRLLLGFNEDAYRGLVHTNWIRTVLWTARGTLFTYLLFRGLQETAVG